MWWITDGKKCSGNIVLNSIILLYIMTGLGAAAPKDIYVHPTDDEQNVSDNALAETDRVIPKKFCQKCGKKQCNFNKPGLLARYCGDCKTSEMVNVRSKKCESCHIKVPSFNIPTESVRRFCSKCADPKTMIDVAHKKCEDCGKKQPFFNIPTESVGRYCADCSDPETMIDVVNKKCEKCNIKRPLFNKPTESVGLYCANCSLPGMVDVVNPRCMENHCDQFAQYGCEKRCAFCFRNLFPWKQGPHVKAKEILVWRRIQAEFKDFYLYNKIVEGETKCLRKYPDFFFKLKHHTVLFECDEHQHRSYDASCERTRTRQIQENQNQPIYIIRLNPDAYRNSLGKRILSCFRKDNHLGYAVVPKAMESQWEARLKRAVQTIRQCIAEYPEDGKPITEIRLFYDGYDDASDYDGEGDNDTSKPKKRPRETQESEM